MPRVTKSNANATEASTEAAASRVATQLVSIGDRMLLPDFRGLTESEVRQITANTPLDVKMTGHGRAVAQEPPAGTILARSQALVFIHFESSEPGDEEGEDLMRLSTLLAALPPDAAPRNAEASAVGADPVIRGLAYDSRQVTAGDLFFALPGTEVDGHDYVDQALERGAAAVILERVPSGFDSRALPGGGGARQPARPGADRHELLRKPRFGAHADRRHRHQRQDQHLAT